MRVLAVFALAFALDRLAAAGDVPAALASGAWWALVAVALANVVLGLVLDARLRAQRRAAIARLSDPRARAHARLEVAAATDAAIERDALRRRAVPQGDAGVTFPRSTPGPARA